MAERRTERRKARAQRQAQPPRELRRLLRASGAGTGLLDALEDAGDAIFVIDADRKVVFFNRRAEAITGYSRDEVLGRDCLAGFRCPRCLEACTVFARGRVASNRLEIFSRDGRRLQVQKAGTVLRSASGQVVGAVEHFRELESSANELSQASELQAGTGSTSTWKTVDQLMATLGRGALLLSKDFHLEHASAAFASLVGRSEPELAGMPAADLFGEGIFGTDSPFRAALQKGERREGWRATVRRPDGSVASFSVTGAPLPSDGCGHSEGYLIMVRPEDPGQLGDEAGPGSQVSFEGMVGRSPAMRRLFQLIDHLRHSDATVLVSGESGTGKELVARAIHARSARANLPFVALNCGALPAELLESELFGHVRGAFTGALRDRPGVFEVAGEGTLFLDEVGDMPPDMQVKLLRVLQDSTFRRLGEQNERLSRCRVIAASLHQLDELVAAGRFREDLFYRLNVVRLALPPLRERREDLDLLVHHLLEKISRRRSRILRLSPSATRTLLEYDWPGNVRQLENALEYATAVCSGQTIHREDLPPELTSSPVAAAATAPTPTSSKVRSTLEPYPGREDLLDALRRCRHRRDEAAKLLGISRTTLWRRMKLLGLRGG